VQRGARKNCKTHFRAEIHVYVAVPAVADNECNEIATKINHLLANELGNVLRKLNMLRLLELYIGVDPPALRHFAIDRCPIVLDGVVGATDDVMAPALANLPDGGLNSGLNGFLGGAQSVVHLGFVKAPLHLGDEAPRLGFLGWGQLPFRFADFRLEVPVKPIALCALKGRNPQEATEIRKVLLLLLRNMSVARLPVKLDK
jgi:hypothetical protein